MVDIGPLHLVVIGFDERRFGREVMPELRALRETGVIRLVDLLLVRRDEQGRLRELPLARLAPDEAGRYGGLLGPLLSGARLGVSAAEVVELGHRIPVGGVGALLLLEHAWAARLVEGLSRAGGGLLAEGSVPPEAFAGLGLRAEAMISGRR